MPLYSNEPANLSGLEKDHPCDTAEKFLAYLNPQQSRWDWYEGRPAWIFRGQADAQWALRATVFRDRSVLASVGAQPKDDTAVSLREALHRMRADFRRDIDEAGIVVPQVPSPPDGMFPGSGIPEFLERVDVPLAGLARHHSLPTELLDWSRHAHAAAYFAAEPRVLAPAACRTWSSDRIAVWALNVSNGHAYGDRGRLRLHEAPGATNPNMRAQSGVFLVVRPDDNDPHGNSVDGFVAEEKKLGRSEPRLIRVTLEARHAPELLRRLAVKRVTGSTMFPGADGVVRAMRERALWDRR